MRSRMWLVGAVASFCTIAVLGQQPPPPAQPSGAYVARCATCHGPTMGGASAPPILSYIRYHTDADTIAHVRETHKTLQIADDELRQVLADTRIMAGTKPAMATGGFTGRRGGRGAAAPGAAPGRGAAPATPASISDRTPTTIKMADGTSRTGILLGETEMHTTFLENSKYVLLARDGDVYREKPITPKADWLTYDGATNGDRYSPLDLINTTTIARLGAAWVYPMPTAVRLEVTPIVVDGIM